MKSGKVDFNTTANISNAVFYMDLSDLADLAISFWSYIEPVNKKTIKKRSLRK